MKHLKTSFFLLIIFSVTLNIYSSEKISQKQFTKHIFQLQTKMPEGFIFLPVRSFIVIGKMKHIDLMDYSEKVVSWAVKHLRNLYFQHDPDHIIDIWLFNNDEDYRKYTEEIFGDNPSTPYGYYSEKHKALIMNIETGRGTLVHELVHPYISTNFPECPPWFNEGLASLYEQCQEVQGKILGQKNWRLPKLKKALLENRVPEIKKIMAMDESEFYDGDNGTHYAMARYICYYMQSIGKLTEYYWVFSQSCKQDPTGFKTFLKVLEINDISEFQKKLGRFILSL